MILARAPMTTARTTTPTTVPDPGPGTTPPRAADPGPRTTPTRAAVLPAVAGMPTTTMTGMMTRTPTPVAVMMTMTRTTVTAGKPTTDTRDIPMVARPQRSGVSVRTRITLTVALLVALALTGSGAIVYLIEHDRNREQARDEVDQEVEEFIRFQENGVDPRTGETFKGVAPLLGVFLE